MTAALGLRVVRGPDWNLGDKDGGHNHVGTVTGTKGPMSVVVTWDMGGQTTCRVGEGGKHDIRVLDSATIGVLHDRITCARCETIGILGARWKCASCKDSNLCTPCYFRDGHDVKHAFTRIDFPGSTPVGVKKRSISQRARALGIYPNATVVRGPDWQPQHSNQDGGSGKEGTADDVVPWGRDLSDRNAVRVNWAKGGSNIYRLGWSGKVDVTCKEEAPGPDFYPDHLASVDLEALEAMKKTEKLLKVGDKIFVDLSKSQLKQLQQSRATWDTRMESVCGEVGEVQNFTVDGNIEIKFDDNVFKINRAAVKPVASIQKGQKVKVADSQDNVERLQKGHGGWDDPMTEIIGKVGTVIDIDNDGDVAVKFGGTAYVFNPACLTPAPGQEEFKVGKARNLEDLVTGSDIYNSDDENGGGSDHDDVDSDDSESDDDAENFGHLLANLMLLGLQAQVHVATQDIGELRKQMVQNVVDGNDAAVRQALKQHPDFIKTTYDGLTMLTLAIVKDHKDVVSALLDSGANPNYSDQKQLPALLVAIKTENPVISKYIIERGANVNIRSANKATGLHIAAQKGMVPIVKLLLEKDCDINAKDHDGDTPLHDAIITRHDDDHDGDTPLHDAIITRHDDVVTILINHPKINLWIKNNKHLNVLAYACMKANSFAVDKLVGKLPGLVNAEETKADDDGYYPLHIAAVNNHIAEAGILLSSKGKADVDALTDTKSTALHIAASEGHYNMVELLLQNNAKWNLKNVHGNTALHLCMMGQSDQQKLLQLFGVGNFGEDTERTKIATFLIKHGASVQEKNNDGKTPLEACGNPRLRDAVKMFAEQNKVTKGRRPQERPSTASVRKEIFVTSIQKCLLCSKNKADVKFLPCNHVVTCMECCYECKLCPICQADITRRRDKDGRVIVGDNCVIS